MGVLQIQRYCKMCRRNTLHARYHFSTGWGLLITILTVGLFLPIWFILIVNDLFKPWRCQTCGETN